MFQVETSRKPMIGRIHSVCFGCALLRRIRESSFRCQNLLLTVFKAQRWEELNLFHFWKVFV